MTNSTRSDRRIAALKGRERFNAWMRARTVKAYNAVFGTQLTHIPRKPKRTKG